MPQQEDEHRQTSFQGVAELKSIGLSPEEITALRHQGFVAHEMRGDRTVYKLRFRLSGRQQVRYLGTDIGRAEQVERLLRELQRGRQIKKQLRGVNHEAAERLREMKRCLEPFVKSAGLKFHGLAIRRPRRVAGEAKTGVVIEKET